MNGDLWRARKNAEIAALNTAPVREVPLRPILKKGVRSPINAWLDGLHEKYRNDHSGDLADYIPELARANPDHFGIALATADGEIYEAGDAGELFTIQSVSKALIFGLALEDNGVEEVYRRVGVEPTGDAFNSIVLDEHNNRPFNPMVNAGAIATTALIKGKGHEARLKRILDMFGRYAGRPVTIDRAIFESEKATGHRNRAIAYLELNSGMIEGPLDEHLDLYFEQCSILVSARDLSVMAATLANNGVNPLTGERALKTEYVKNVLSVMASCGMYDYSGEWVYRVGLPAKSGVGGGIIAVLPGQFGFGVFSPRLDAKGNSHRGVMTCMELSQRFFLHTYDAHFAADNVVRVSYRGGSVTSKRQRGDKEKRILDRVGFEISIFELQGSLHFATAEQLIRKVLADLSGVSHIILDGRRISRADFSALLLLRDLSRVLGERKIALVLAGFDAAFATDWQSVQEEGDEVRFEPEVDLAMEYCEDRLIGANDPGAFVVESALPLSEIDMFARLEPEELARVETYLFKMTYKAEDYIIREGDAADRLFFLASGAASVRIMRQGGLQSARLAAFRPGVAFGEFALFDKGRRVTDVVAETDSTCYVLTFDRLSELEEYDPKLYHQLLFGLGRLLTDRLRRLTAEVRALA